MWQKGFNKYGKPNVYLIAGWYWGSISASEAREALLTKSEGTFLLRDSSHPQYMLALSVKTCCGPTSVRIEYSRGAFWLDSFSPGMPQLQSFPDVLSLLQHYTGSGHMPQEQASSDLRRKTKPDHVHHTAKDRGVPLKLMQPLFKPEAFPTLQHLVRLTINRHTKCPEQLPLPKPLLCFMQKYPFLMWHKPGHTLWPHVAKLGQPETPGNTDKRLKYNYPKCDFTTHQWTQFYYCDAFISASCCKLNYFSSAMPICNFLSNTSKKRCFCLLLD